MSSSRIEMSSDGVKMKLDHTLMILSYYGELTLGDTLVGRDSKGNLLGEVCKALGISQRSYVQVGCDADKGMRLQLTETECLIQLGTLGIMQNKDRVLYGIIEDDEFVKCIAVYDKKTSRWGIESKGSITEVSNQQALAAINRAVKGACIEVMSNSNICKASFVDENMQADAVDISPSPLLHFPPSFFCSTTDSDSTTLIDKLQEVEKFLKYQKPPEILDNTKQAQDSTDKGKIGSGGRFDTGGREMKKFGTEEGPPDMSFSNAYRFKKQRKPGSLVAAKKQSLPPTKAKTPVGKITGILGDESGREKSGTDRFRSTADNSDRQKQVVLSEEKNNQMNPRMSVGSSSHKSTGSSQRILKKEESIKVRSFLETKPPLPTSKTLVKQGSKTGKNLTGGIKKQASVPQLPFSQRDSASKHSRQSVSSANSAAKSGSQPEGEEMKETGTGVSELVRQMESKIDALVKDIINSNAEDYVKTKLANQSSTGKPAVKRGPSVPDKPKAEALTPLDVKIMGAKIFGETERLSVSKVSQSKTSSMKSIEPVKRVTFESIQTKQLITEPSPLSGKSHNKKPSVVFQSIPVTSQFFESIVESCSFVKLPSTIDKKEIGSPDLQESTKLCDSEKNVKKTGTLNEELDRQESHRSSKSSSIPLEQTGKSSIIDKPKENQPPKGGIRSKSMANSGGVKKKKPKEVPVIDNPNKAKVGLGRLMTSTERSQVEVISSQQSLANVEEKPRSLISTPKKETQKEKIEKEVQEAVVNREVLKQALNKPREPDPQPKVKKPIEKPVKPQKEPNKEDVRIAELQKRAQEILIKYKQPEKPANPPIVDLKKSVHWSEAVNIKEISPVFTRNRSKTLDSTAKRDTASSLTQELEDQLELLGVKQTVSTVSLRLMIADFGIKVKPLGYESWTEVPFWMIPVQQNPFMYRLWLSLEGIGVQKIADRMHCLLNVYPYELFVILDTIVRG